MAKKNKLTWIKDKKEDFKLRLKDWLTAGMLGLILAIIFYALCIIILVL